MSMGSSTWQKPNGGDGKWPQTDSYGCRSGDIESINFESNPFSRPWCIRMKRDIPTRVCLFEKVEHLSNCSCTIPWRAHVMYSPGPSHCRTPCLGLSLSGSQSDVLVLTQLLWGKRLLKAGLLRNVLPKCSGAAHSAEEQILHSPLKPMQHSTCNVKGRAGNCAQPFRSAGHIARCITSLITAIQIESIAVWPLGMDRQNDHPTKELIKSLTF